MNSKLYERLYDKICELPVIDTHEHLFYGGDLTGQKDILKEYLVQYLSSDIISAGFLREQLNRVTDEKIDIAERWKIVEPYWEACRYTGYGQALDTAVKKIYGVKKISGKTIEELNNLFIESKNNGEHMRRVLHDICKITVSLTDLWMEHTEIDRSLFRGIWQPVGYVMPYGPDMLSGAADRTGIEITDLDSWIAAMCADMDLALDRYGVKVIKCAIAYQRTLKFDKTDKETARKLFCEVYESWGKKENTNFPHELQNYVMHEVMRAASERSLTVQFHTGLLEGNGNVLGNSNPELLNNLFLEYPGVDFDLFHISYPYWSTAAALAKMFPNVYIDMCWAHIISPAASRAALDDFLDSVPYNKISAFGGDYSFADGVCGHLEISRRNIAEVLAKKVRRGIFSERTAVDIARSLYYDNPNRIFKLGF